MTQRPDPDPDRITLAAAAALPAIRQALAALPARCRYHGERLERDRPSWGGPECCDTGAPALLRRQAEASLKALTLAIAAVPDSVSTDTGHATGGIVRTPPVDDTRPHGCAPLTSPDKVRTPPTGRGPDTPGGVRVEYRARVPRHLLGAALAEAADAIHAARTNPPEESTP